MVPMMLKSGLVGIMLGVSFGHGAEVEIKNESAKAAREACYRISEKSMVDIYRLRTLGRAESRQTGTSISGVTQGNDPLTSQVVFYQLRSKGRAEAKETGRPDAGSLSGTPPALSEGDRISQLRALGRGEARGTGRDYCREASNGPVEIGFR